MSVTAKYILVKGDVQGVFFRKYTKEKADELKLNGWVENTGDGDVKIFVQGNENDIDTFIKWCWQGSPKSEVENVEVNEGRVTETVKRFTVHR